MVLVGNTLQFAAFGEFEDGSYQDITSEVEWHVDPASVGTVDTGTFTAVQVGTRECNGRSRSSRQRSDGGPGCEPADGGGADDLRG